MKKYDVIIVGDGPIAMTTALLLKAKQVKVALVTKPQTVQKTSPSRLFAIAHKSREIFEQLEIDDTLARNAQPINHIRLVDDNSHSKVDFKPKNCPLNTT